MDRYTGIAAEIIPATNHTESSVAVAPKRLTLDEFLQLPEEKPALEYFQGEVSQKVSPRGRHGTLHGALVYQLTESAQRENAVVVLPELRATFAGASVVPDISVYRWERVPVDDAGEVADDFTAPPDIAVEIASPRQSSTALVRRCLWYVEHGVQIALLVDPDDKSVLAFRPNQPTVALHGSDRIDLSEILPRFELTVDQLFAWLRRP
jgi:Uma2 family endonuclease